MIKEATICSGVALFIFVVVFFLAVPCFTLSSDISFNQYVLDEWSTANGLPLNVISTIGQTPDGYIWFGTGKGLVRFDGGKFKVFNKINPRNFPATILMNSILVKAVIYGSVLTKASLDTMTILLKNIPGKTDYLQILSPIFSKILKGTSG
jgi:hypothetical protein